MALQITQSIAAGRKFKIRLPTHGHTKETKITRKRNEVCGTKSVAKCRKRTMFRQHDLQKKIRIKNAEITGQARLACNTLLAAG